MMIYYKKKSNDKIVAHNENYAHRFPSDNDKAVPNNFSDFDEALDNPAVRLLNTGALLEIGGWFYILMRPSLTGATGNSAMHFAERITPITIEQLLEHRKSLVSVEEKLEKIKIDIREIIDTEMKDTKYFYGLGYELGRASVAMFSLETDAIRLTNWHRAILVKEDIWFTSISNGYMHIDNLWEHVLSNIPLIDDF